MFNMKQVKAFIKIYNTMCDECRYNMTMKVNYNQNNRVRNEIKLDDLCISCRAKIKPMLESISETISDEVKENDF